MNPVTFITPALLGLTLALPARAEGGEKQLETSNTTQGTPSKQRRQTELDKRFEKARLLERVERNPEAAAKIYRSLTITAGGSKEFKGRCWLRLGICLDLLGEKEKAKIAYGRAVESSPLVAVEAKARLQGQSPKRLEYRVRLQIDKLIQGKATQAAKRDLLWIGEQSVPYLIDAIEDQKLNLDFVVRATDILLALGGPKTIAFLKRTSKSEDTLLRRALVRGFTSKVGPDLAKAMALYLKDPDERTRDEALRRIVSFVPTSTILDFLEAGPDSGVGYLLGRFRNAPNTTAPQPTRSGYWYWDYQDVDATKNEDRLLELYLQWYGKELPASIRKGSRIIRDHILWDHLLRRPKGWTALSLMIRKADNSNQMPQFIAWRKETAPSPKQILELAQAFPAFPRTPLPSEPYEERMRQVWINQQLRGMIAPSSGPSNSVPLLGPDFMEVVPGLAALDYDTEGMLSLAIEKLGQPKDLRMAVENIPKLYSTEHLAWISRQTPGVDLLPVYEKSLVYIWERRKVDRNRFTNNSLPVMLYRSLLRCEDPRISAFAIEEARKHPVLYETIAKGLLAWQQPDLERLKQLLVLPSLKQSNDENRARGNVLIHIAKAGMKNMGTDFGRADVQGTEMSALMGRAIYQSMTGLQWLLAEDPRATPGPHAHGYSEEQLGSIVRDSLIAGGNPSWKAITDVLQRSHPHSSRAAGSFTYKLSDPILKGIIQALPHAPPGMRMQYLANTLSAYQVKDYPSMRGLYLWMLQDKDAKIQARALHDMRASDFPDIGERCLSALNSRDNGVQRAAIYRLGELRFAAGFDKVVPFLESAHEQTKYTTVTALVALDKKRGLEAILPMIRDSSSNVRLRVIRACRSSLDPMVTGTLLIGLQDSNKDVQTAAQAALDAIRFYHEQKSFWDAWNKRSKLGYANPAAALLAQAQKDQPLKIRLQAIRSLGTLADPGSLPFLIQLMKDGNAEIQKAAEQALDRINAKKH